MNGFAEKHLDFFDSVVLFADLWRKTSTIDIDFVLTSSEETSKVSFTFLDEDFDLLVSFQHQVMKHFFSNRLVACIKFIQPNIIELFMNDC